MNWHIISQIITRNPFTNSLCLL